MQKHIINKNDIDRFLLEEVLNGREDVLALFKMALGQKYSSFLRASRLIDKNSQEGQGKLGQAFDDTQYYEFSPQNLATGHRLELDTIATYLAKSIDEDAEWLHHKRDDGIPMSLTFGYGKLLADARQALHGNKKATLPFQRIPVRIVPHNSTIELNPNDEEKLIKNTGLSSDQIQRILGFNLKKPHHIKIDIWSDNSGGIDGLSFHMTEPSSGLETRWAHSPFYKAISFEGWEYHGETNRGALKPLMANRLALAHVSGIEKISSIFGVVGAYAFARVGFLPHPDQWVALRAQIEARLDSNVYASAMTDDQIQTVRDIIQSPDPKALWKVADLRDQITDMDGQQVPLGSFMLRRLMWMGEFDLNNSDQMDRAKSYIDKDGPLFDASFANAAAIWGQGQSARNALGYQSTPT